MSLRLLCALSLSLWALLPGCKKAASSTPVAAPAPPTVLEGGVSYQVLATGDGAVAKAGDKVFVHYTGTLENGTKFDSSVDRGEPFPFRLGQGHVIKGWDVALVGMKEGERRKLTIPPAMGYGSSGAGDAIPPNATLLFEVELVKVQ